ncbi:MAG: hypothetical protein EXR97_03310 [Nitrospiraceae bacterium]|nr:hypothetical protein [Nitrospiraceae bacterium]MSR24194.1 hypothetical protein [Nitrospiraceae bacterium]
MPQLSPADAAQNFYAIISRALSGAALEDYGLSVSPAQGDQILRELLSLCLFWAWSALDAGLADKNRDRVWAMLLQRVNDAWASELALPPQDLGSYVAELSQRRRLYESLAREGGNPLAIATEAAGFMESESIVEPEDRLKMLALMVDLVPVDELGAAVEELEILD